jgi:predicted PurR-regulated permease PerM
MPFTKEKTFSQAIAFYTLLLIFGALALMICWPFSQILAIGVVFGILLAPFCRKLARYVRYKWLSALIILALVLLIIAIPIFFIGKLFLSEVINLYNGVISGQLVFNQGQFISGLPESLRNFARIFFTDIASYISPLASQTIQGISFIVSNVAYSLFALLFVGLTSFYIMKDSDKLATFMQGVIPLSKENETTLIGRLESSINGIVVGQFLAALIFAIIMTIGLWIFGLPSPLIWGVFALFAYLIPNIGGVLILIPALVYLWVMHSTVAFIGMSVWGILTIGIVYNFLSPKVVGSRMQLHPMLVLIGIIGGLKTLGIFGFFLGPIIISVFFALLDIYRTKLA